jgi:thiol-disulfide isomerase/thioredoxin
MRVNKILVIISFIFICGLLLITFSISRDTLALNGIYQDLRFSFHVLRDVSIQADGRTFIGTPFIDFTLEDMSGHPYSLYKDKAKLKIIILFNTEDCAGCLDEYRLWKKIYEIYSDNIVSVVGINNDKDINSLMSFIKTREIRFPVLHDPEGFIKKSMRLRFSPLRITLDSNNKIIDIEKTGSNRAKQLEILSYIRSKLQQLKE